LSFLQQRSESVLVEDEHAEFDSLVVLRDPGKSSAREKPVSEPVTTINRDIR
jgi:hypothetical protein